MDGRTLYEIEYALLSLDGVMSAIVETHDEREIVTEGSVRLTINGGYLEDIGTRLCQVLPVGIRMEGFSKVDVNGKVFRFDHVNPLFRAKKRKTLWSRFWGWLLAEEEGVRG
jgi:hypothetical protein